METNDDNDNGNEPGNDDDNDDVAQRPEKSRVEEDKEDVAREKDDNVMMLNDVPPCASSDQ